MKTLLIILIFIGLTFSANTKHLFWYKCEQNNYKITDSANGFGPNIQGDVIKHEGKAFTAAIRASAGSQDPIINLGNGLDNAQGRSSVFWYKDLCDLKLSPGATLKSAKFRGEYRDNWGGNAFCNAGPIRPRVGVVKMQGHLDALGYTLSNHPDNAVWADPLNPLSGYMGYSESGYMSPNNFEAQEIKNILVPQGADGKGNTPLEGKFFEMDITTQVQFILEHNEQHGIAAVCMPGDGSTGKINLYAFEDGGIASGTLEPWTQDGNTCHLVLEIENGTLVPKSDPDGKKYIHLFPIPDPTFNKRPIFSWNSHDSISTYLVSASTNSSFSEMLFLQSVSDTFFKASYDLPLTSIYWKVSKAGDTSYWSDVLKFRLADTLQSKPSISPNSLSVYITSILSTPITIDNSHGQNDLHYSFKNSIEDSVNIIINSDYSPSCANIKKAILNHNKQAKISYTNIDDYDKICNDISKSSILIIPHHTRFFSMSYSSELKSVFSQFTRRGGTIIALYPSDKELLLYNTTMLNISANSFSSAIQPITIKKPDHYLFKGVANLKTTNSTSTFTVSNEDSSLVLAACNGSNMILEKRINMGRLIIFGCDIETYDSSWAKIIGNAINGAVLNYPHGFSLSPDSGIVPAGKSTAINLRINPDSLDGGQYVGKLQLRHNSVIVNNPLFLLCTLEIMSKLPQLISYHPNPTSFKRPNFRWHSLSPAKNYTLQVSANRAFNPILSSITTVDTFASPSIDLPVSNLYWRVKSDLSTEYSFPETINIQSDSLPTMIPIVPDTITERRPTLIWHKAKNAPSYQVLICTGDLPVYSFDYPWLSVTVSDTFFTLLTDLPYGRVLWKVRNPSYKTYNWTASAIDTFWVTQSNSVEFNNTPKFFDLNKALPNPFNPSTTIFFSVPQSKTSQNCLVSIIVYDVKGNALRKFINLSLSAGKHQIKFDGYDETGNALPSGIYYCNMKAENFKKTIKLSLIK